LEATPSLGGSQHSVTQFTLVGLASSRTLKEGLRTVRFARQCNAQHSIQAPFASQAQITTRAQITIKANQISVEIILVSPHSDFEFRSICR
jgi:hypothetical protein